MTSFSYLSWFRLLLPKIVTNTHLKRFLGFQVFKSLKLKLVILKEPKHSLSPSGPRRCNNKTNLPQDSLQILRDSWVIPTMGETLTDRLTVLESPGQIGDPGPGCHDPFPRDEPFYRPQTGPFYRCFGFFFFFLWVSF